MPLVVAGVLLSLIPQLNHTVFSTINSALPWQTLWMTITNSGSVVFTGCLLFIALRKYPQLLSNALLCAPAIHYSVKFAKYFCAELRPEHTTDLSSLVTLGPALAIDNYSMPSGHTATAFISAVFIAQAHSLQGWKLGLIFSLAALVGISRIAVGAHWPSDILVGAGMGILIGSLFTHKKLSFQNRAVALITYALYLPFFVFAIGNISAINSPATLISEGLIVVAGAVASALWICELKYLFFKNKIDNPAKKIPAS